jgi:hypothetical protein
MTFWPLARKKSQDLRDQFPPPFALPVFFLVFRAAHHPLLLQVVSDPG